MKKLNLLFCLILVNVFMLCPFALYAQNVSYEITANGVVYDELGDPIIGASVVQKGTSNGTLTNGNGEFSLRVPNNAVLIISYIGYATCEVKASKDITVGMNVIQQNIKELVVIGYGTARKSDISGSVASVDSEAMLKKSPTTVNSMLQGAVAGVYVSNGSGAPNSTPSVRIRGVATINNSADPLYVVDGVQMGTDISYLSPSDIESIEVLKDASATAIYGAQGANGVILITTKRGRKGEVYMDASAEWGMQSSSYEFDMLGVEEYSKAIRTARANDGSIIVMPVWGEVYDGRRNNINWQKVMTQNVLRQNYTASITGGTDKVRGVLSARYIDNDGLVINSGFKRFNLRTAVDVTVNNYLEIGGEVNLYHSVTDNISGSKLNFALLTPTMDYTDDEGNLISPNVVNPDGTYGTFWQSSSKSEIGSGRDNLYASQVTSQNNKKNNKMNSYLNVGLNLAKGLKFRAIYSYSTTAEDTNNFIVTKHRYNPIYDSEGKMSYQEMGMANQSVANKFSMNKGNYYGQGLEDYLTYNYSDDLHNLTLMIGNSVSKTSGSWASSEASDFPYETIRDISLTNDTETKQNYGAYSLKSKMISYYGRLMYSFHDRYNLTASIRRDGSSHFGKGNRWGTFPSFAASWRVSEESFMKNLSFISNAKIRIGWGKTGNAGSATDYMIPQLSSESTQYKFYSLGSSTQTAQPIVGYAQQIVVDEKLKWETNIQSNFGLDLGFLDNSLNITLDYFIRTTKDLLLYESLRPSTGFQRVYTNFGKIRNNGLEFSVSYEKKVTKDWSFDVQITGSTIKNKIIECGNDITSNYGFNQGLHWQSTSRCSNGYAIGSWYGYKTYGVFRSQEEIEEYNAIAIEKGNKYYQQNAVAGDLKFVDNNNDGTITDKDMTILGDGFPTLNYGINLFASYKNIDFSVNMYGVLGQDILSYSAMRMTLMTSSDSFVPNILNSEFEKAWSVDNPNGVNPRLSVNDANWNMRCSDFWIRNGNYLKISNLQVGYNLPKSLLNAFSLNKARVYMSVNNLCVISPYNKYGDPELGGSILFQGLDAGRYPSPRTFVLGLNVQF